MAGKPHNITVDVNDILYYVDYDLMNVYVNKNNQSDIKIGKDPIALANPDVYIFDETLTQTRYDRFKEKFIKEMQTRYKSLKPVSKTVKGVHHLLASDLFIIAFEDNNWSIGIELLNNPKCKDTTQQETLLPTMAKSMRDILLDLTGEIHTRTGSWSTEIIDKAKAQAMDEEEKKQASEQTTSATDDSTDTSDTTVSEDTSTPELVTESENENEQGC